MKVLHINYSDSKGGAATSCVRLLDALNKNSIDSKLLVNEKYRINRNDIILNLDNNYELYIHKMKKILAIQSKKILGANNIYKDSISFFRSGLVKKINKFDCDIVNFHWICNEMIAIEEFCQIKKPQVWTIVDMWPFVGSKHYTTNNFYKFKDKKFDNKKKFNIENWVLNRKKLFFNSDIKIVCISNWLKGLAEESQVLKNNQIYTVPCSIDHLKWFPINKQSAKKCLKFDLEKKYFLFSAYNGINDYRKGFDLLLESIQALEMRKEDFSIVIIGNASGLEDLKKKYKFNFIVFDKHFDDDVVSLRLIYSASDLLIVPSRIEAFGQIVLEAGACELPCVTFDKIGTADIISHKEDGYLANYLDINDLINGIRFCLDQKNYNKISKNIRNKIINNFSYDVVAKKYKEIYKDLT